MSLLDLPGCIMKCDVCGHEPVDTWAKGFGCDVCKGREAVVHHGIEEARKLTGFLLKHKINVSTGKTADSIRINVGVYSVQDHAGCEVSDGVDGEPNLPKNDPLA